MGGGGGGWGGRLYNLPQRTFVKSDLMVEESVPLNFGQNCSLKEHSHNYDNIYNHDKQSIDSGGGCGRALVCTMLWVPCCSAGLF